MHTKQLRRHKRRRLQITIKIVLDSMVNRETQQLRLMMWKESIMKDY